jgi:hypothetical protein
LVDLAYRGRDLSTLKYRSDAERFATFAHRNTVGIASSQGVAWMVAETTLRFAQQALDAVRKVQEQHILIRCIFGNPFRPVAFDSRWRTEDVLGLARGIYEDRAFDRLPLLADALMDAGCDDQQVLGHCRSEGPHARGCWVVDLALGKE